MKVQYEDFNEAGLFSITYYVNNGGEKIANPEYYTIDTDMDQFKWGRTLDHCHD